MDNDKAIIGAVDRWAADPNPYTLSLARLITAHVRSVGKHFLSARLLERLTEIRRHHATRDRFLDAFLEGILDKHEGRFGNRTYLALPLLAELGVDPETMSRLLVADIVQFETAASQPVVQRIKHAERFAGDNATDVSPWFALTVLPVSVVHDEYFFIRTLQAHEMVFTVLDADVRAATRALRSGNADDALAKLDHAVDVFARAAMLFRLVATMRADQFHAFREFTQGASAIQSEAYKRFEVACGRPSDERLASDAFTNVPAVRTPDHTLSGACLDARTAALAQRLDTLESAHQRWKTAHHSLARKMLGAAAGSGYTSGVPYLKQCLSNRLFCPHARGVATAS